MQIKNLRWSFLILLIALNIGADQYSKNFVRQHIEYGEQIPVIKGFFVLTKVENTGAFLSLGDGMHDFLRIAFLNVLPGIILLLGCYYIFSRPNLRISSQLALCFLIGGGLGNLYDRILHGSVTDFMHMDFNLFQTGIFNIADISIMIGIGILLIQSFRKNTVLN